MRSCRKRAAGGPRQGYAFADRTTLISYLQYAVDDVAELNETSAQFLRMAITHLKGSNPLLPAFGGASRLS